MELQPTSQWQRSWRNFSWRLSPPDLQKSLRIQEHLHMEEEADDADIDQNQNQVFESCPGRRSRQKQCISPSVSSLWLPLLVVLIPNLALPGVLLTLVYADKFKSGSDLFVPNESPIHPYSGYILFKLSTTRLAIITSCSSTLTPFLTASIMALWKFRTIRIAQRGPGSSEGDGVEIHRIPQLSLLISLLGASLTGLINYIKQCFPRCLSKRTSPRVAPVTRPVHSTAVVLCCCLLLAISTWAADTIFHAL